jgi:hypothetical protein
MNDKMPIANYIEIPENLSNRLAAFLDKSPQWDIDRAFSAAIAAFLEAQKEATNA